jgi:endonuclease/exonuclease/phosphatase (EEP) superfamily protein YafD
MNQRDNTSDRPAALPRRLVVAATSLAALGLAALCVIPWISIWPFTLFEHFRVQYVELGALVVIATAALRLRGYFDVALIATLIHVLPVAADLTARPRPLPSGAVPIRVLVLNVHTSNSSFDRVRHLIEEETPDVIGLVEVDTRWLAALAPAVAGYPGRLEQPRDDNFGVALYARGSVAGTIAELASPLPSVTANVTIRDSRFAVILTHPLPPVSGFALARQQAQLDAVADLSRATTGPLLVMGDLNATPWSTPFRRLVHRSGLCDSRAGFGLQASFPASSRLLRIPIDHLLASCSIGVRARRIGPDVGSDHLPVIVDLALHR